METVGRTVHQDKLQYLNVETKKEGRSCPLPLRLVDVVN